MLGILSVVSQSSTSLTDCITARGGLLALPADLVIPVISEGAHSVELVRQVYSISSIHNLETPERRFQDNVVISSPLSKRGSEDEMSVDDAIIIAFHASFNIM
mgnify:CR=1 FL=1